MNQRLLGTHLFLLARGHRPHSFQDSGTRDKYGTRQCAVCSGASAYIAHDEDVNAPLSFFDLLQLGCALLAQRASYLKAVFAALALALCFGLTAGAVQASSSDDDALVTLKAGQIVPFVVIYHENHVVVAVVDQLLPKEFDVPDEVASVGDQTIICGRYASAPEGLIYRWEYGFTNNGQSYPLSGPSDSDLIAPLHHFEQGTAGEYIVITHDRKVAAALQEPVAPNGALTGFHGDFFDLRSTSVVRTAITTCSNG